jgi:SNF2 family DNA or RNA helicase
VGHEKHVLQRFAMTGTPVANDASDLWAIMHFVAPDEYPTKSKFVDRYCNAFFNAFGGLEIGGLRPDTKPELMKFLHPRMRRMDKSTVLSQLPEKVFATRYVQLSPTQMKAYMEMEQGLVTRLPDGTLMIAKGELVGKTRMLQFTSGNMTKTGTKTVKTVTPTGETVEEEVDVFGMCEPCPKLDAMEEILEEMGDKPLVVAAVHKQLIDLAEARLVKAGISYGKITGDVPQWQRDLYVKQFQAGELRVMLLTMQAGGVGITLTKADTMLRLQCSWSMVDNTQVVDRIHRIGSEKHQQVTIIDLVAAGTIEEDQVDKVHLKHMIMKDVVGDDEIV